MNRLFVLLAAFAATAALAPLLAHADTGQCATGLLGTGTHQIDTPAGTVYIDDRSYAESDPNVAGATGSPGSGLWLYQESNGIPGLQRGGTALTYQATANPDVEVCNSAGTPDTLVF